MPKSQDHANYADAHLHEIIQNYTPDILWNDVNCPKNGNPPGIVRELFRQNPQAVVDDRWQHSEIHQKPHLQLCGTSGLVQCLKPESQARQLKHYQ